MLLRSGAGDDLDRPAGPEVVLHHAAQPGPARQGADGHAESVASASLPPDFTRTTLEKHRTYRWRLDVEW